MELHRKNLRFAHWEFEKDASHVKNVLRETATASVNGRASQEDVLGSIDSMLARMRGVKRKLTAFADEERRLHAAEEARVRHLSELYDMNSVEDVKYEVWSRTRLDRLLVDYLLRHGYNRSARLLAEERDIEALVDVDTFEQMSKIRDSLRAGSAAEALAWCTSGETKKELRKKDVSNPSPPLPSSLPHTLCLPLSLFLSPPPLSLSPASLPLIGGPNKIYLLPWPGPDLTCPLRAQSNFEFMLRFQQYIELVRTQEQGRLLEAIGHAKRFLLPYKDSYGREVQQACGLLAWPPAAAAAAAHAEYGALYAPARWAMLADLFTATHNSLLALPAAPLLHIALSSGLSALKTPACHSAHPAAAAAPSHSTSLSLAASVCPICSTELNQLARSVPYAFHSKSHVEPDLLLLPNGRAYGKARLEEYSRKAGLLEGQVKDLRTGEIFGGDRLKKVYIT